MMMVSAVGIASEVMTPKSADAVSPRGVRRAGLLDCLVVSGDASRRSRFEAAVELAGWLECASPATTGDLRQAVDRDFQLAIVDIAEELAARPGTLLVICGSEDNVDEELWARQLGAWLYLPGVCDGDSLTSLCVEARRLRAGAPTFAGAW